jgi:LmbE family N-acetylglucosaminyl deacetylase
VTQAFGTVVSVWAHPDDEAYCAGGLLASAVAAGCRVVCVTATHATGPRAAELAAALAVLGVTEHRHLGHEDGRCDRVDPAGPAGVLAALLREVRPDTVVTFGADGFTGHADHRAVSAWVGRALARADLPGVRLLHPVISERAAARFGDLHARFPVFDPGLPATVPEAGLALALGLDGALLEQKLRALAAHDSQTRALREAMGEDRYAAWLAEETFVAAAPRAAGPDGA